MKKIKKFLSLLLTVTILLTSIIIVAGAKTTNSIGDINGDGKISAADARLALRFSASLEKPTEKQKESADVNGDGKITAADARKILRVSAGLDKFDIKEENTENKEPDDNKDNIDDNKNNNDNTDDTNGNENTNNSSDNWFWNIENNDNIVIIDENGNGYINNIIVIDFSTDDKNIINEVINNINGTIVHKRERRYRVQVQADSLENLEKLAKQISTMDGVWGALVERTISSASINSIPNDPWKDKFQGILNTDWNEDNPNGLNWWLETIEAPSAWNYNERFSNIKIGVIDDGFDTEHEDLQITVLNNNMNSKENHGTHVSGIIGATANNNLGISGLVWNKELYGVDQFLTETQKTNNISILGFYDAIELALKNGCKTVNCSIGAEKAIDDNFNDIYNQGMYAVYSILLWQEQEDIDDFLIVESAGNELMDSTQNGFFCSITNEVIDKFISDYALTAYSYEDVYSHFVIVGGIEKQNDYYKLSSYDLVDGASDILYDYNSAHGNYINVVAPGTKIFSTVVSGGIDGSYGYLSGTSMATPIVTGVASLIWSINPNFTSKEVKEILCNYTNKTAKSNIPFDTIEYPIVNAKLAVEEAIRRTDKKGTATGTFVDSKTGTVVNNVTMECIKYTGDMSNYSLADFNINATDGTFSCELYEGVYEYKIFADGYAQERNIILDIKTGKCDEKGKINLIQIINDDDNTENSDDDNTGDSGDTEERTVIDSGNCGADGDNVTWTLYEDGELVISGSGEMEKFYSSTKVPWYTNRESITSVKIKNGVLNIGGYAFYYCQNLLDIYIPDSVTSIGDYAFYGCDSLTNVEIPDSVTSIGAYVFGACQNFKELTIGSNIKSIGEWAFISDNLTSVYAPSLISWLNINFANEYSNPLCYIGNDESNRNLYIDGKIIEEVIIPYGVENISSYIFYNCESIKSVKISDSVKRICDKAFCGCGNLTSITITNSVTSIGDYAFAGCENLTSVIIPDSVTRINDGVLSGCINLETVTIGNNVTRIDDAFINCTNLKSITIGNGVRQVSYGAFEDCVNLKSVYINDIIAWCNIYFDYGSNPLLNKADLYLNNQLVTDLIIPYEVTEIKEYAFQGCRSLESITVSDNVKKIDKSAFADCINLKSVKISDSVTYIGYRAFANCTNLTNITIPDSVLTIGNMLFQNCINLEEVSLCSIKSISGSLFENCTNLKSITIPNSVTYISNNEFYSCKKLEDVYYAGTKDEWKAIEIGLNNENLTNATIHYNS